MEPDALFDLIIHGTLIVASVFLMQGAEITKGGIKQS